MIVELPIPGFSEAVAVTAPKLEEEVPQEIEKVGVRVQTITAAQIENGGYYDVGPVNGSEPRILPFGSTSTANWPPFCDWIMTR